MEDDYQSMVIMGLEEKLAEVKADRDRLFYKLANSLEIIAERDRLRDALVKGQNDIADIINDLSLMSESKIHGQLNSVYNEMGRSARTALKPKCECKNGRRGPNCHDYHEGGQR